MADGAENNSCCFIARRIADVVVSAGWGEVCFCARVRRGAALDSRSPPSPPAALGPWKSRGCRPVQSAVQCSVAMDETPGGCPQGRTVDGRWSMIDGKSCQPRMFCNLCPGTNTCVPAGTKEPRGRWRPLWTQAVGRPVVTVVICCRHQMSPIGQRRTHFAHGCRLQVEAKAQLVCSSARPLWWFWFWFPGKRGRRPGRETRQAMM